MDYDGVSFFLFLITLLFGLYNSFVAAISGLYISISMNMNPKKIHWVTVVYLSLAIFSKMHVIMILFVISNILQYSSIMTIYGSTIVIISVIAHLLGFAWFGFHLSVQFKDKFKNWSDP